MNTTILELEQKKKYIAPKSLIIECEAKVSMLIGSAGGTNLGVDDEDEWNGEGA